jgi:cytosine/adenosine deaminase-related metal-dependent hydrolase
MIHASADEIALVKEHSVPIVHCPNASMRRGMGALRVGQFPEMLAAGITVALGSDGWSGAHDIARQAYLAASVFREIRDAVPVITAETALEMATCNGARALGMLDQVGSLEPGKRADIVVHRARWPGPLLDDPVPNLVYYAQSRTVDTVFVDGEAIFDGGRFTRFDADAAIDRINRAAALREAQIGFRRGPWPIRH